MLIVLMYIMYIKVKCRKLIQVLDMAINITVFLLRESIIKCKKKKDPQ